MDHGSTTPPQPKQVAALLVLTTHQNMWSPGSTATEGTKLDEDEAAPGTAGAGSISAGSSATGVAELSLEEVDEPSASSELAPPSASLAAPASTAQVAASTTFARSELPASAPARAWERPVR
eukprot:11354510-Alexandrium_andersonii.AAC.2